MTYGQTLGQHTMTGNRNRTECDKYQCIQVGLSCLICFVLKWKQSIFVSHAGWRNVLITTVIQQVCCLIPATCHISVAQLNAVDVLHKGVLSSNSFSFSFNSVLFQSSHMLYFENMFQCETVACIKKKITDTGHT